MINKITENIDSLSRAILANEIKISDKLILLDLTILLILMENCPNTILDESKPIVESLLKLNNYEKINIKTILGKCWNFLIKINKSVILELHNTLIAFFICNFNIDDYDLNFTTAEFFCFLLDKEENLLANESIAIAIKNQLDQ